ncbi:MAG: glycerophosphodiester phosphodiesterase family protein [Muribaculaceae bacterium]|nr:glycerophosphodiester phosphodiesterase family protein [Muribaculaceae bacterium]
MKQLSPLVAFPRSAISVTIDDVAMTDEDAIALIADKPLSSERLRWYGLSLIMKGSNDDGIRILEQVLSDTNRLVDDKIQLYFIELMRIYQLVESNNLDSALASLNDLLHQLFQFADKKGENFIGIAVSAMYSLAMVHNDKGACECAEKELSYVQKILEKVAKKNEQRFAEALVEAVSATTYIYKSRLKQINTLAHYQVATTTYLAQLSSGGSKVATELIDSLQREGDLLQSMEKYRDSVKYYTKALRYLQKISETKDERYLRITINLAKSLIHLFNRHDTGVQLLNTARLLAVKLGATNEVNEIDKLLIEKPKNDIMNMLKKLFVLVVVLTTSLLATAQLTVGHRGSIWGVENTRSAFINGAMAGFDGLECDVKVTKDGKFVISHDDKLSRLNADSISIPNRDFDYLKRVPLTQVRRDGKYYEGNICSLEEYLDICNKYGCFPVIELKWCNNIYSNNSNPDQYCYDGIPELIRILEYKGLKDKAVILTSMRGVLAEIRKSNPTMNLQLLTGNKWEHLVDFCKEHRLDIDIRCDMDTTKLVETFHNEGLKVNVWCANTPEMYQKFVDLGVDYITTDFIIPENKTKK